MKPPLRRVVKLEILVMNNPWYPTGPNDGADETIRDTGRGPNVTNSSNTKRLRRRTPL